MHQAFDNGVSLYSSLYDGKFLDNYSYIVGTAFERTSLNSATCFWVNIENTLDPVRLALRLPRLLALVEPDSLGVPVGVGGFSSAGAGAGSGSGAGAGAASSFFFVFFFFSLSAYNNPT